MLGGSALLITGDYAVDRCEVEEAQAPLARSTHPHCNQPHGKMPTRHGSQTSEMEHSIPYAITSAPHLPPRGMRNWGNTCYANASLQCLMATALSHALIDPLYFNVFKRYASNINILALGSGSVDDNEGDHERCRKGKLHEGDYSYHELNLSGSRAYNYSTSSNLSNGTNRKKTENCSSIFRTKENECSKGPNPFTKRLARRNERRLDRIKSGQHRQMSELCRWLTTELSALCQQYHPLPLERQFTSEDAENKTITFLNSVLDPCNIYAANNPSTPTYEVVDPGRITRNVSKLSPTMVLGQQEDSHEFLRALLSALVMDGFNTQISSLFDGLLESAVTCTVCNNSSIMRDRYMDLSLEIEPAGIVSLYGALEHFTKEELLSIDNKVTCDLCEKKQVVRKGLRLATAPTVLVCHLKRFAYNVYGQPRRLNKVVSFPLTLDISGFMSYANKSHPAPYELVSVLVHEGRTCNSGHYLAYVRGKGGPVHCPSGIKAPHDQWYRVSDTHVMPVSLEVVLRQKAYILMYQVKKVTTNHPFKIPKPEDANKMCDSTIKDIPPLRPERSRSVPQSRRNDIIPPVFSGQLASRIKVPENLTKAHQNKAKRFPSTPTSSNGTVKGSMKRQVLQRKTLSENSIRKQPSILVEDNKESLIAYFMGMVFGADEYSLARGSSRAVVSQIFDCHTSSDEFCGLSPDTINDYELKPSYQLDEMLNMKKIDTGKHKINIARSRSLISTRSKNMKYTCNGNAAAKKWPMPKDTIMTNDRRARSTGIHEHNMQQAPSSAPCTPAASFDNKDDEVISRNIEALSHSLNFTRSASSGNLSQRYEKAISAYSTASFEMRQSKLGNQNSSSPNLKSQRGSQKIQSPTLTSNGNQGMEKRKNLWRGKKPVPDESLGSSSESSPIRKYRGMESNAENNSILADTHKYVRKGWASKGGSTWKKAFAIAKIPKTRNTLSSGEKGNLPPLPSKLKGVS